MCHTGLHEGAIGGLESCILYCSLKWYIIETTSSIQKTLESLNPQFLFEFGGNIQTYVIKHNIQYKSQGSKIKSDTDFKGVHVSRKYLVKDKITWFH